MIIELPLKFTVEPVKSVVPVPPIVVPVKVYVPPPSECDAVLLLMKLLPQVTLLLELEKVAEPSIVNTFATLRCADRLFVPDPPSLIE